MLLTLLNRPDEVSGARWAIVSLGFWAKLASPLEWGQFVPLISRACSRKSFPDSAPGFPSVATGLH